MIDGVLQLDFPRSPAASPDVAAAQPFVIGAENALLAPPIERLLSAPDLAATATQFNPLVIVGPSGSGKSHVAHGLVRSWLARTEPGAVAYFTAADFGRDVQAAYADKRVLPWRSSLRAVRLLVVDDVDRLRLRSTIQRELRLAIDALVASGGVIVVTSLREPSACPQLDPGLRDRLVAGLTVRLQRPDFPARRAILAQAAVARGLALDAAQLHALAKKDSDTPAQLLGRLASFQPLSGQALNGQDAAHRDPCSHTAALKQILAMTARYFCLTQASLTGPSRRKSLVGARNVFVHLARRHTAASYAEIGRTLGNRDHTTIMHADRRLADWLAADPAMQQAIDELDRLLAN